MTQLRLEHIDEYIDEEETENVPILHSQERYDEWIEALAKHDLNVIIDDQENPELPLRETIDDTMTHVEHSGTIQSFDYADNYNAIKGRAREIPEWLANDVDEWKRNPTSQMHIIGEYLVARDVAAKLDELIREYEEDQR